MTGPSLAGGNISLGTLTIDTSSTNGSGGKVLAIANGTGATGQITLGSITTSGSIAGGSVTIIGENTITTNGTITTTGTTGDGNVSISVAQPNAVGTVIIGNGEVITGSFAAGGAATGNVNLAAVSARSRHPHHQWRIHHQ